MIVLLVASLLLLQVCCAFVIEPNLVPTAHRTVLGLSDWSDFRALDDDDDDFGIDQLSYAKEDDTQEHKAMIGAKIDRPVVEIDADPIFVPLGTRLELTEENVIGLLSACREEIGTMFGYSDENRGVGITGSVEFVELDGPVVMLRLEGRFWHQRTTVLERVRAYLMGRVPELMDVIIEDEWQLDDEANEVF